MPELIAFLAFAHSRGRLNAPAGYFLACSRSKRSMILPARRRASQFARIRLTPPLCRASATAAAAVAIAAVKSSGCGTPASDADFRTAGANRRLTRIHPPLPKAIPGLRQKPGRHAARIQTLKHDCNTHGQSSRQRTREGCGGRDQGSRDRAAWPAHGLPPRMCRWPARGNPSAGSADIASSRDAPGTIETTLIQPRIARIRSSTILAILKTSTVSPRRDEEVTLVRLRRMESDGPQAFGNRSANVVVPTPVPNVI